MTGARQPHAVRGGGGQTPRGPIRRFFTARFVHGITVRPAVCSVRGIAEIRR